MGGKKQKSSPTKKTSAKHTLKRKLSPQKSEEEEKNSIQVQKSADSSSGSKNNAINNNNGINENNNNNNNNISEENALDVSTSSGSSESASTSSGSMSQSFLENESSERSFELLLPSNPAQNSEEDVGEKCWTPESVGNHPLDLSPIPISKSPSSYESTSSYKYTSKSSWNASSSSSDLSDSLEALRIRIEMSPNGDERPSSDSQNESFETPQQNANGQDLAIRAAEEREKREDEIVDTIEKEEDDRQGELAPKNQVMQEIEDLLESHAQETQTLSKRHAQEILSTLGNYAIVGRLENNQILGNVGVPRDSEVGQEHRSSSTLGQLKARIRLLEANNQHLEKLRKYEPLDCLLEKIRSLVPTKEQAKQSRDIFEHCKEEWNLYSRNYSVDHFGHWIATSVDIKKCKDGGFYFNTPQ